MANNKILNAVRDSFIDFVARLFKVFAKILGHPEVKGMPLIPQDSYDWLERPLSDRLPVLEAIFPPQPQIKNYIHVFISDVPKPIDITKYYYEDPTEGYYNFYFENYKNLFFLPNGISEFIQIRLNFCVDLTYLEVSREVIFCVLVIYFHIVNLRTLIAWFVAINPYTFPFNLVVAVVDWTDEATLGLSPSLAGVNLLTSIILAILGRLADSINCLVFTMPYLPSEGVPAKTIIDGEVKDVLVFRYLPILWYKHPIPDSVREYWFDQRTEILLFMQKAYEKLDIQFLPDKVLPLLFNIFFHGTI